MKKIVPFKKEVIFKNNISEITSISLEHTLKIEEHTLKGNFIINGEYKITEQSLDVETFSYEIPFVVAFESKYILDNTTIDIDDFYYEIVNNRVLALNVDVLVDGIEEHKDRCVEEETKEEIEEQIKEQEDIKEIVDETTPINIFNNINIEDSYNTYKVYIVREDDTLENIMEKYKVNKEQLEEYNDLSEIKIGNKIIIPVNEGN